MPSARLLNAFKQAEECWERAVAVDPEFVEMYLELAQCLLEANEVVTGDAFRSFCAQRGLRRPPTLHPNTWVSGVNVLRNLGWVTPITKVEPKGMHNHMNSVTLWKSTIYTGAPNGYVPRKETRLPKSV